MKKSGEERGNGKKKVGSTNGKLVKKAWTPEEEKALSEGIEKFGKGKWKEIKQLYSDVLKDRTVVDIK
ncbi:hypothetical protein MKW92_039776, partial [Papaver armeniacum]